MSCCGCYAQNAETFCTATGLAGPLTGLSFPEMVRVLRGAAESRSIRVIPYKTFKPHSIAH